MSEVANLDIVDKEQVVNANKSVVCFRDTLHLSIYRPQSHRIVKYIIPRPTRSTQTDVAFEILGLYHVSRKTTNIPRNSHKRIAGIVFPMECVNALFYSFVEVFCATASNMMSIARVKHKIGADS